MDRLPRPRIISFAVFTFLVIIYLIWQFELPKFWCSGSKDVIDWSFSYFKQDAQVPFLAGGDGSAVDDANSFRERHLIGVGKADITGYVSSRFSQQ